MNFVFVIGEQINVVYLLNNVAKFNENLLRKKADQSSHCCVMCYMVN